MFQMILTRAVKQDWHSLAVLQKYKVASTKEDQKERAQNMCLRIRVLESEMGLRMFKNEAKL
jgi:hypothetical protein